jgi:hypothetical protein
MMQELIAPLTFVSLLTARCECERDSFRKPEELRVHPDTFEKYIVPLIINENPLHYLVSLSHDVEWNISGLLVLKDSEVHERDIEIRDRNGEQIGLIRINE